jgi:molybdenum-dependent DNA-binding transcriptional regulator ModE
MDFEAVRAHEAELAARSLEFEYRRQWEQLRRLERLERATRTARARLTPAVHRPLQAGR